MVRVEPYSWDGVENREEFESILSVLDFPMESLEGDELVGDWDISKSHFLGPIPFDELMGPLSFAHTKTDFAPIDATPETKHLLQEQGVAQTQSPVSVLQSSSSKNSTTKSHMHKRPRSKRARPPGPSPWLSMSLLFPSSSKTNKISKKSKERKNPFSLSNVEVPGDWNHRRPVATKKCTHCEVTKTPQWREGPLGPKTLCNACGVRYRSRRLFPEYRPAASPTFVPSLHSNSHKKVIEMRRKGKEMYPEMEFVPFNSYLFEN